VAVVVLVPVALQPWVSATKRVYVPVATVVTEEIEGFEIVELNEAGPAQR
jgi:hypothetical protein